MMQYHLVKELGQGAQGAVYLVKDPLTHDKYAAKIVIIFEILLEFLTLTLQYSKYDRYALEKQILQNISGLEGFPKIMDTTEIDGHSVIVMNILGDNLRALKDKQGGKLSFHTSLQLMHLIVFILKTQIF